jgi:ABC-2 type transport system ATP-binding protein
MEIRAGEIFGLLGPNGAGKSTTIGILTTRTRPTSGRAILGDYDVWQQQVKAKQLIGVVPQRPNLDFSLTAREILLFHGAYFGQNGREREQKSQALLEKFKLTDRADQMVRGFSGGMMQRLSIARAMMHDPEVLFLDEPSAGLDPQTRLLLWEIIRDYNRAGKTIVLTTHYMDEADSLCERLAIIDHGRIIAQGTPQELKSSIPGGYLLRLRFDRVPEELTAALQSLPGVSQVRSKDGTGVDIYADRGGPLIAGIANAAQASRVDLCDVHIAEPSLETLFLHHTGRSLRD